MILGGRDELEAPSPYLFCLAEICRPVDGLDRQRISACVLLTGLWWWAAEESTAPGQVDQALGGGQRPTES